MTAFGFCNLQGQELIADAQQNSNYSNSNGSSSQSNATDEMYGFRLQGEALYWKTTLDNQSYAGSDTDPTFDEVFPTSLVKKHVDFSWDWGFRLEAGYRFCEREWGLDVVYTQLHSKASNSVTAPAGDSLTVPFNTQMLDLGANYATHATSHFNNKFYAVDGLIERKYDVNSQVEFYPSFGVKGAWIRQTNSVTFTGGDVGSGLSFNDYASTKFSGAGPKISFASKWMMGWGFSFYNKLGASLLFGNTKASQTQTYTLSVDDVVSATHNFNRTIPALEMLMGLEYLYTFEDVAQSIGFNLGFDGQYYFNEYVYEVNEAITTYGGLGFYGISFGASWHF